jgi:hypothetical protein
VCVEQVAQHQLRAEVVTLGRTDGRAETVSGVYDGLREPPDSAGSPCTVTATGIIYLDAGQSVKAQAFQSSTVALNITSISQYSPSFTMAKQ